MQSNFLNFDEVLQKKFVAFSKTFKEADQIDAPVYAALAPNFNGKSAILVDGKTRQIILAFGLDVMAEINDDIDVLFPHELFHLYHATVSNIKNDGVEQDEKFMLPLWSEGLPCRRRMGSQLLTKVIKNYFAMPLNFIALTAIVPSKPGVILNKTTKNKMKIAQTSFQF